MAAYAALVSVMHIIDALQLPRPPISLHPKQVESLTQNLTFLEEFIRIYNPHLEYSTEADPLESRIADAAYAAEDLIESHIVDQITNDGEKISSATLYEALEKVIQDMALIQIEAMEIKQTLGVQHQLHTSSTPSDSLNSSPIAKESSMVGAKRQRPTKSTPSDSLKSSPVAKESSMVGSRHQLPTKSTPSDSLKSSAIAKESSMVGAEEVLFQMKDELTSDCRDLQIIPIVGMGGSGKTTLAINIYQDSLIKEHFHISAWATISQEYSISEMLIQVLRQLNLNVGQNLSRNGLGEIFYKHLFGRKYLIILDDMWSIEAWDGIKRFLPDNKNGSRIVVTTRLSNLASDLPNSKNLKTSLLNEVDSWELLSKTVFGEKSCPPELEGIGKRIGKSCKGLPLSIVVIGGLLAKSKHTREFWESINENLNSIVNSEDDERCFKILHLSYKQLPVYLKPCFLYMGVFGEDKVIRRSTLVKLWVAEGFLKPVSGKSLEEIAKAYLKELADRNLVLIDRIGISGEIKCCKIHDLLRDLCLREAEKERFYTFTHQAVAVNAQRRIVISKKDDINALLSIPLVRSLMWDLQDSKLPPLSLRLLRILNSCRGITVGPEFKDDLHGLVNLRFLAFSDHLASNFHRSIRQLWNLQSLIVAGYPVKFTEPTSIWHKPHFRHVRLPLFDLADPPNDQDDIVLENLQTLETVVNFKFSEQVVKRIPNIKKLNLWYSGALDEDSYCINNLNCLVKLESLTCGISPGAPDSIQKLINFPNLLKKLSLLITEPKFYWNDILDKIGVLPFLQKLTLEYGRFKDRQWETTEGQFRSLKYLALYSCESLEVWTTEKSHIPCLEQLGLTFLRNLKEIPLDLAEVSTLGLIEVIYCNKSAVESAKRILEAQEELYGNEAALQVRVSVQKRDRAALESLASPNFHLI